MPGGGDQPGAARARRPEHFDADNASFFLEPLPGRDGPLGNPGGSIGNGPLGIDTEFVAVWGRG